MSYRSHVWTRRQSLYLLAGMAGSLTLHACSSSSSTDQSSTNASPTSSPQSMKLSMGAVSGWVGYTPLYIAQGKGFFKDQGLDFSFVIFSSNPDNRAAFAAGKTDACTTVTSEAVVLSETGKDFKIVLVEDNSLGADGILARKNITSIQDFKGKEIAVEVGGVSHFFLLQVLKQAGLNEDDVKLVNVPADAAAAAYQSGKIDIAVTYAPFMQKANTLQSDGRIIYDSSKMPTAITDLYIFDSKFAATNPNAVSAFVKGIFKGIDFLKANPQDGAAIAAKQLGTTPADLLEQLKGVRLVDLSMNQEMLGKPDSDLSLLKSLNDIAAFLKTQGQIKGTPDMAKSIDPSFVNAL